jgi:hypothetical protein
MSSGIPRSAERVAYVCRNQCPDARTACVNALIDWHFALIRVNEVERLNPSIGEGSRVPHPSNFDFSQNHSSGLLRQYAVITRFLR